MARIRKGLFELKESVKDKPPASGRLARLLYDGLSSERKITRQPKMSNWQKEFDYLLEIFSVDEIEKTINWYIKNVNGEYTPVAFCAKSFRDKFPSIFKRAVIEASTDSSSLYDRMKAKRDGA